MTPAGFISVTAHNAVLIYYFVYMYLFAMQIIPINWTPQLKLVILKIMTHCLIISVSLAILNRCLFPLYRYLDNDGIG